MAHIRKISQDILVYRSHIKVSALPWRLQTNRKACDRVGVTRDPCNSLVSSLLAETPTGRTEKRWRLPKNGRNPALQQDRQVTLLANFTLIIWYCTYIWSGTAEGGWESWGYWSRVTVNAVNVNPFPRSRHDMHSEVSLVQVYLGLRTFKLDQKISQAIKMIPNALLLTLHDHWDFGLKVFPWNPEESCLQLSDRGCNMN